MESLVRNADGERPDPDCSASMLHQLAHPVHAAAQASGTAVDEVDAVVLNVEANKVATEDALQN